MVTVEIPSVLRARTGGLARVQVEAGTVAQALEALCLRHPELRPQLFTAAGALKRAVGIFSDEEDLRSDEGLSRALGPGAELVLVAAMAGG